MSRAPQSVLLMLTLCSGRPLFVALAGWRRASSSLKFQQGRVVQSRRRAGRVSESQRAAGVGRTVSVDVERANINKRQTMRRPMARRQITFEIVIVVKSCLCLVSRTLSMPSAEGGVTSGLCVVKNRANRSQGGSAARTALGTRQHITELSQLSFSRHTDSEFQTQTQTQTQSNFIYAL